MADKYSAMLESEANDLTRCKVLLKKDRSETKRCASISCENCNLLTSDEGFRRSWPSWIGLDYRTLDGHSLWLHLSVQLNLRLITICLGTDLFLQLYQ